MTIRRSDATGRGGRVGDAGADDIVVLVSSGHLAVNNTRKGFTPAANREPDVR